MSLNAITLVGRAGRDPETRFFDSGAMVTNLTLAVNRPNREEEPDWFNLEIWGKQAQVAADYVRKGSLIGVVGRMTSEQWTDRSSGERRSKPVVKVERLALLGTRPEVGSATSPATSMPTQPAPASITAAASAAGPAAGSTSASTGWSGTPISDAELPF